MFRQPSIELRTHKQPWGTIVKPNFPLGQQKLDDEEIDDIVKRLYKIPSSKERIYKRPGKAMDDDEIKSMLDRLTKVDKEKIPESDRRVTSSVLKPTGVVTSFAWKGYN
ncbi:hypothetical protein FSP39_005769 [Pinctada imbricata]|uniref:Uncharacterized protein n=1 Tax=Pinctada imbricata TaxID=66713 RepID=A0AA89BWK0_PINIB|nr:hypothetical protein FSP39_005769 [Pinctada imbricata]